MKSSVDSPFRPSKYVVYSDPSATACGAHLNFNGEQMCHKQLDVHECGMSSTWRELTALYLLLSHFCPFFKALKLNGFLIVKMLVELSKLKA